LIQDFSKSPPTALPTPDTTHVTKSTKAKVVDSALDSNSLKLVLGDDFDLKSSESGLNVSEDPLHRKEFRAALETGLKLDYFASALTSNSGLSVYLNLEEFV
jgi:hypothetical protein